MDKAKLFLIALFTIVFFHSCTKLNEDIEHSEAQTTEKTMRSVKINN